MSNRIKLIVAAAIAVGVFSPAAFAAPKYQSKRIPGGPRPDRVLLVRVDHQKRGDRPYALTGQVEEGRKQRRSTRYVPTHPKGTHTS